MSGFKTCFGCNIEKNLADFYQHPMMKDGHLNKCKVCKRFDVAKRAASMPDAIREYERKRKDAPQRIALRKRLQLQDRKENPKRMWARNALAYAVSSGIVIRPKWCETPNCEKTGTIEAHHVDYDNPLAVVWLCINCHRRLHRQPMAIIDHA